MRWKRTLELLRRSLYGKRDTPSEPTPVGLPTGPILKDQEPPRMRILPQFVTEDGYRVSTLYNMVRIANDLDDTDVGVMPAPNWVALAKAERQRWLEGPPKLLFRQYAIEHIFDNKSLPRGDAADRIDVRTFAGTLQCIDMHGWYYFSEPLSRLAPIIVRGNDITRHFLVPDVDGK